MSDSDNQLVVVINTSMKGTFSPGEAQFPLDQVNRFRAGEAVRKNVLPSNDGFNREACAEQRFAYRGRCRAFRGRCSAAQPGKEAPARRFSIATPGYSSGLRYDRVYTPSSGGCKIPGIAWRIAKPFSPRQIVTRN